MVFKVEFLNHRHEGAWTGSDRNIVTSLFNGLCQLYGVQLGAPQFHCMRIDQDFHYLAMNFIWSVSLVFII